MTALDTARANRIKRSEHEQIVNKANPMAGYTVVYKAVTECAALSDGAYRTYMVLLGYDYHNGRAIFPGLDTLAAQRGVARRTIQGHITELKAAGLLLVERRGLNLTNEYELPDASAWTPEALLEWQKSAHPQNGERSGRILHIQSGKNLHIQSGKNLPPNKEQVKKKQTKKEEGVAAGTPRRTRAKPPLAHTEPDVAERRDAIVAYYESLTGHQRRAPTLKDAETLVRLTDAEGVRYPVDTLCGAIAALWFEVNGRGKETGYYRKRYYLGSVPDAVAAFDRDELAHCTPTDFAAQPEPDAGETPRRFTHCSDCRQPAGRKHGERCPGIQREGEVVL